MLQPKKPNPNQKTKRITPQTQYESQIDWDKVRSVNDNVAVQAAKMFDPTGISSYPDVYYAGKDLYEGKGSVGNLALNVLGALPMLGKSKVLFNLAKAKNASRTVTGVKKVFKGVEKVAEKVNKVTNPLDISSPFKLKNQRTASKQISKADVKNLGVDLLDLANVGADVTSVVKAGTPVAEEVSKVIKKELETPSLIDKNKIIQYYNTDPKRGGVEKPGQLANVQYVPVSNSAELKMWQEQKLAFGTNQDGIMKKGMNPRKKYATGSNAKGIGPNNYIPSPNEVLSDYNIMLAKADQEVAQNALVPIVSMVGGLAQTVLGMGKAKSGDATGGFTVSGDAKDTTNPAFQSAIGDRPTAANGMNNVNADVEVEGGEMYETPQGETGEFQGPSHEQGGIPMEVNEDIPEGTKVYSDRLKIGKETLAERKEKRERQIANLEKTASQPLIDSAIKNAAKRKMEAIQKEEMADLQFQEQVNNMQQMADTVVAAFGTSMSGVQANPIGDSMRYGNGTGADGVTEYENGTPGFGILNKYKNYNPYSDPKNWSDSTTSIQDYLKMGSQEEGYGVELTDANKESLRPHIGKAWVKSMEQLNPGKDYKKLYNSSSPEMKIYEDNTFQALSGGDIEDKDTYLNTMYPYLGLNSEGQKYSGSKGGFTDQGEDIPSSLGLKAPKKKQMIANSLKNFEPTDPFALSTTAETWTESNPLPEGVFDNSIGYDTTLVPEGTETMVKAKSPNLPGTMLSRGLGKMGSKIGEKVGKLDEQGLIPGMGDMVSLFGNYLGATAGLKNAAEQRSTDITHRNVFANAGKESQKLLDNARSSIETAKAQAIVKATTTSQGGKRAAGNTSRSANVTRAMNWLYDTALNQQIADISANAAGQVSDIFKNKSSVAMSADQLKGTGEHQANMANEAAKDAYYTAKGLGLKDQSMALQQTGKDLNSMKQNKMIEKLMKSGYGKWTGLDSQMNTTNKNTVAKTSETANNNVEIPDGKGGKISMTQAEFQELMGKISKTK